MTSNLALADHAVQQPRTASGLQRIRIAVSGISLEPEVREFCQSCVTFGRQAENDVILADPIVSKHHGEIRITPDGLTYRDLGSTNGSRVRRRGALVAVGAEPGRGIAIEDGDEILFGGSKSSLVARIDRIGAAAADWRLPDDAEETLDIAKSLRAGESLLLSTLSEGLERDALLVVHRFMQQATGVHDVGQLLEHFGASALEALPTAERVTIHLLDRESNDYQPVFARDRWRHVAAEPLSRALRELVIDRGRAVQFSVNDPELDGSESLANAEIIAGLCAPLYDGDRLIGVAQADSRVRPPALTVEGLEVFTILSHQLALCIANAQLTEGLQKAVEELTHARADMERLAFYDPLTGLPNRRLYLDRLDQALRMSQRRRQHLAVMFLDLDNFKPINDTLGHDAGDEVLCTLTQRLCACVREQDTVARFGGDEFAMLLHEVSGTEGVCIVVDKILAAAREPITIGGQSLQATVSIGVAMAPQDGTQGEALLKKADVALYRTKQRGRDGCHFFSDE